MCVHHKENCKSYDTTCLFSPQRSGVIRVTLQLDFLFDTFYRVFLTISMTRPLTHLGFRRGSIVVGDVEVD